LNGRVRQELLTASWFETLEQDREMTSVNDRSKLTHFVPKAIV